jgi:hypothetical protein
VDNFEQKRPIAAYKTHSLLFYLLIKILSHVMRNLNEFNIPAGNSQGYEIKESKLKDRSKGEE